jgi:very-short-patch-repair endonuclease
MKKGFKYPEWLREQRRDEQVKFWSDENEERACMTRKRLSNASKETNRRRWSREENHVTASVKQREVWSDEALLRRHSETSKKFWNSAEGKRLIKLNHSKLINSKRSKSVKKYLANGGLKVLLNNGSRFSTEMNKPESVLFDILSETWSYEWTGGGSKTVGHRIPDFTHTHFKWVIEMYGSYWHGTEKAKCFDKIRMREIREMGYRTLVVWESELNNADNVRKKIIRFHKKCLHR